MKIVAIQECSVGNAHVGDMWLETKIFDPKTPVKDIIAWGERLSSHGKLIITVAG